MIIDGEVAQKVSSLSQCGYAKGEANRTLGPPCRPLRVDWRGNQRATAHGGDLYGMHWAAADGRYDIRGQAPDPVAFRSAGPGAQWGCVTVGIGIAGQDAVE